MQILVILSLFVAAITLMAQIISEDTQDKDIKTLITNIPLLDASNSHHERQYTDECVEVRPKVPFGSKVYSGCYSDVAVMEMAQNNPWDITQTDGYVGPLLKGASLAGMRYFKTDGMFHDI